MRRRSDIRKQAAAPVPAEPAAVGLVPGVLTPGAVAAGYMPPHGQSGLPAALESAVPAAYRYWKATTLEAASATRNALVESGLFTADSLLLVDGEARRVVKRTFLADEEEPAQLPELAQPLPPGQYAALMLKATKDPVLVYETGEAPVGTALAKHIGAPLPWVGVYADAPETVAALHAAKLCSVFKVATRPGLVFASNVELAPAQLAVPLAPVVAEDRVDQLMKSARARLMKNALEERFVLGIVLEPETLDYQKDVYSADEIRKAAHRWMAGYRTGNFLGKQHTGEDFTGKILVLESYIAPADFTINGETVKAGTWVLGVRIIDDELWEAVKAGNFTGFSIGGDAIRLPEVQAQVAAAA